MIMIEMVVVAAVVVANHQDMWWEAVVITVVALEIEDEIIKVNLEIKYYLFLVIILISSLKNISFSWGIQFQLWFLF